MVEVAGKVVSIIGRLAAAPTAIVTGEITTRGGSVQRGLSRRTGIVVVARGSVRQLTGGRLQAKLARADQLGATCTGELGLLRALGLLPPPEPTASAVSLEALADKAGIGTEIVRLLGLFDLIDPHQGQCSFRDLVTAREVARLLGDGLDLPTILVTAMDVARPAAAARDHPLTRLKLVGDGAGRVARQLDGRAGELDGQMRLPLPVAGNPSVDELFEAAEEAEQVSDLGAAEALYRRCIALDRRDPIAPFNLANVLCAQGRSAPAKLFLRMAASIDPAFAEAWYNLALLLDEEGDKDGARNSFERAIGADPTYADPLYNLAHLAFEAGDFARAGDLWQRYLALDPDSEWSRRARHGLALCRQQARFGKDAPELRRRLSRDA
jgi:tetratricopeptide (TPR) repeat protein